MNVLFTLPGCPLCHRASMAVLSANVEQTLGEKIAFVGLSSGDPRLKILEEMFGSPNIGDWAVPVLVLEKPKIAQFFQTYFKTNGGRALVRGVFSQRHYFLFLREFLSRQ